MPGLLVGCLIGNITSPLGWLDIVCGASASLLAAVSTRALRGVRLHGVPILAPLPPVLFNALIVGAEITLLAPGVPLPPFSIPPSPSGWDS